MKKFLTGKLLPAFVLGILVPVSIASAATIDFEGLADGTDVGATYSGLGAVFTGATVLSAGISLNEVEFPPRSGTNVALDASGPIIIVFSTPVFSFQGYFTYATGLSLVGTFTGGTVASTASAFTSNFVSSGNPSNELLMLSALGGIDTITISGDPNGGSFVMDDLSFVTSGSSTTPSVPEPGSWILFATGLLGVAAWRLLRNRGFNCTNEINS